MNDADNYIWLFERKEKGFLGAFVTSILFHALLIALLASTSIFHPMTGDSERVDIFWLYPYLFLGGEQKHVEQFSFAPEPAVVSHPTPPPAPSLSNDKAVTDQVIKEPPANIKTPLQPPLPPTSPPTREVAQPLVSIPAEEESEQVEETEMKIPARIEEPQPVKPEERRAESQKKAAEEVPKEKPEPPAVKPEKPTKEPEKPIALPKAQHVAQPEIEKSAVRQEKNVTPPRPESTPVSSVAKTVQQPSANKQAVAATRTALVDPRHEEKRGTTSETPITVPDAAKSTSGSPALTTGNGGQKKTVTVKSEPPPLPVPKPAADKAGEEQSRKPSEVKGLFLPPVYGDLKLEIRGKDEELRLIKVVVVYRDFPVARRNRPLTKAEARRAQPVTPKLVRTDKDTLQAVIEIAKEGIYDIRLDIEKPRSVEAAFSVRLFEKSNKSRTKSLGTKKVAQQESIVKILMPEGIFWDDPTAFSGSMEDSDGVTKFNSDSGLAWKEYNN